MGKADRNERIDDDILQSRADVLRARDVMPPFKQGPPRQEAAEQKDATGESADAVPQEGKGEPEIEQEKAAEPAEPPQKSKIPRFDLAEDIMAEQRRITAIRRKAPAEKKEPEPQEQEFQVEPPGRRFEPVTLGAPQEQKIIAQIVARDIEKLLRGEAADA